jgi:hypothetical protein
MMGSAMRATLISGSSDRVTPSIVTRVFMRSVVDGGK